jgi:hypothetical protein
MTVERTLSCGLVLVTLSVVAAPSTLAQSQNGAIAGVVKDITGTVLAGVTIEAASPALIEKTRTVVTDGQGMYRIVELRPGSYTVSFALAGFNTVRREAIEVSSSFTATINAELPSGNVAETITLSEDAPVVDTQNVATKAVTSRELMDALPTDRNFTSLASMTPGMQVVGTLQNVGGSDPEARLMLQTHGSRIAESRLFVDGMSVMSGNGTGGVNFGNYLNNAMAQELVVNTDSMSAEFELSGVTSNFVTREGSNTIHSSFTGRYASAGFQSDNLSADLIARGLSSGNRIQKIWDANPSVGGPLVRDRVWLFSSVRHWGTYNYVAGLYNDLDRTALVYTPDLRNPAIQPVWHLNADARLTFQATSKNKINTLYHYQYSDFGTCLAPSLLTAPSGCAHNKNDPQWFAQASWNSPLTSRVLVEAGGTITAQNSSGRRDRDAPANLSAITESSTGFSWRAPAAGFGGTRNNQSNYRGAVSYVTGTHAAKVGFTLMQQWRVVGNERNNGVNYTFFNGVPNRITQFAEPITFRERVNYNLGLYAQDQWTRDRVTLNLGMRADFLNSQVDEQSLPAGPLIPARRFGAIRNVPNWRDLSPRLGAAYDVFGNGRTAVKASLGRYVGGESYTIARAVNPLQSTVSSASRNWNDAFFPVGDSRRENFAPDCDLTNVAANGECGPANPNTFGQTLVRTTYDDAITRGFGVRPYNWGASLSVQHELFPDVSVAGSYFRRWYGNFSILTGNLPVTRNLVVTNSDFSHYCIAAPADPRLPGAGTQLCGFYDVSVAKFGLMNNLITGAKNFGKQEDVFDGFDMTMSARLPKRAFLAGGVSLGRERTNTCYAIDDRSLSFVATSPRTKAFCDVHPPMKPNVKFQGVYPWPWWGLQAAATFQSLAGPQILAQQETTNAQILPSLGRNLAACGTAAVCNATVLLDLLPPATRYGDRIYQVDVRFSKTMRAGRAVIRPMVSVYNLLNANPVLSYNNRYGPSWPAPTAILTARFADIGVQVDF